MSQSTISHYDLLEVPRDANRDTIRAAHASLSASARERYLGSELTNRQRDLDTAFVVLGNREFRAQYDRSLDSTASRAAATAISAPTDDPGAAAIPEALNPYQAPSAPLQRAEAPRAEAARLAYEAGQWSGFWRRVAAQWIDALVLYIPSTICTMSFTYLYVQLAGFSRFGAFFPTFLCNFLVLGLYHGYFLSGGRVATPGRMAAGIAVLNEATGESLSFGRAYLRAVLSMITGMFVIPNLVMLFSRRRRTVADMLGRTVVVRYKEGGAAVLIMITAFVAVAFIGILAAVAIPQYQAYVRAVNQHPIVAPPGR